MAVVPARAQRAVEVPLTRVLRAVVTDEGRVDYRRLAAEHRDDLDAALRAIDRQDPAALRTDAQKTAFYVNAYNAHVMGRVLEHGATNLERQDLFQEFFRSPLPVAGHRMTLDQLEHGVLRRQAQVDGAPVLPALRALRPSAFDVRIHAALNCAAVSCPPLLDRAYTAETLDADLAARWRAFLGSSRAARLDGNGRLTLSSLFDWFAEDFEASGEALGDVILAGMPRQRAVTYRRSLAGRSAADLRADDRVSFAYDWTVNRSR
ncbi:hypothetical protein BSZ37_09930 [Rubrivirga marina]|uniref:DUF547 domain-containing protein n=2 Tax=Rubrivirga marina TaxID=1196024 RepID=A0A271IZT1_9BACT|nr:hypothetical protein BSZ37_09930 [Rubrivirga marina]